MFQFEVKQRVRHKSLNGIQESSARLLRYFVCTYSKFVIIGCAQVWL